MEVKIGGAGLRHEQLADYHQHLSRKRGGTRGLLVLSRSVPQQGLLDQAYKFWLGTVLWEHVIPLLRRVCPTDDELVRQWPLFLEVLNTRNDLGTEPVDWGTVCASGSRTAIRRIVDEARLEVEAAVRRALAKRPTARLVAPERLADVKAKLTKGRVGVDLFVPAGDTIPAAQLTLQGTGEGIVLVYWAYPLSRPRGPLKQQTKRRYDQAMGRLATKRLDPPYTARGDAFARQVLLRRDDSDVRAVVADALLRELQHIARSGFLDEDLRVA